MRYGHFVVQFETRKRGCIGIFNTECRQLLAKNWQQAVELLRNIYEIHRVVKVVDSVKAHDVGSCCGVDYHCRTSGERNVQFWAP